MSFLIRSNITITLLPGETTKIDLPKVTKLVWIRNNDEGGTATSSSSGITVVGTSAYSEIEFRSVSSTEFNTTINSLRNDFPGSIFITMYGDLEALTIQEVIDLLAADGTFIPLGLTLTTDDPGGKLVLDPSTGILIIPLSTAFNNLRMALREDGFESNESFDFKGNIKFPLTKLALNELWFLNEGSNPVEISILNSAS